MVGHWNQAPQGSGHSSQADRVQEVFGQYPGRWCNSWTQNQELDFGDPHGSFPDILLL